MAVVQISKIQVRRGQKNSNSGVPQLSSAEFAWAVDTQELFIGNGSVQEGAPYVGNTKILTEHDNLLELISSYRFAADDTAINLSVSRSLQSKLDEYVSVVDFGAIGDGSTDCVEPFETAFNELYIRNTDTKYKKVIVIPNGEYLFSSDLKIPSNITLKGETRNGVVLNIGNNNIRFVTSSGLELAEFNSTNRPKNINISNLTIQRTTGQVTLSGVLDSEINDVTFLGEHTLDSVIVTPVTEPAAIFWENNLIGTSVTNLKFRNCSFERNSISVKCLQTGVFETTVDFDNCKFFVSDIAVFINGMMGQGNKWHLKDCVFEEIAAQAFYSTAGSNTLLHRCEFKNVGNHSSSANSPEEVMVYFGEKNNNTVLECTSNRQQEAGFTSSSLTSAYAEVYNASNVHFVNRNYSLIYLSDSFRPLAVFSALNRFTKIDYCLNLGKHTRFGSLYIAVSNDLPATDNEITITDSYTYSPRFISTEGGALMTNFEFSASLTSNRSDDDSTLGTNLDTIVLSYKNPLATGQTGSISFDVTYGV